jgi:hypothetical protein
MLAEGAIRVPPPEAGATAVARALVEKDPLNAERKVDARATVGLARSSYPTERLERSRAIAWHLGCTSLATSDDCEVLMDTAPELELQQEMQRFATQFIDRITQATEALEESSHRQDVRDEALRKNLRYIAAALEIATGPVAEINLVDMIVFVRLSRAVLERHWIPELYGDEGLELAEIFARSEEELAAVAERALGAAQRRELEALTGSWLEANPDQFRVEGIRFSDFSSAAGAAGERAMKVRGFLSSMKTATRAASQALLLSERVLFLVNRMPSLWRLQARLGAREMLSDAVTQLSVGPEAPMAKLTGQARGLMRSGLTYVALLAGGGMLLWWLGSFVHR